MNNVRTVYQYTFNDGNNFIGVRNNPIYHNFTKMDYKITVTTEGIKATYYQNKTKENRTEKED